jgi:uncharacterized protein (DUF305 family)
MKTKTRLALLAALALTALAAIAAGCGDDDSSGGNGTDAAFVNDMVPHNQGAITMAKEELAKGENSTLRGLAEDIVSGQEREIAQMREWSKAWYGSSAGSEDSMHGSDDSMHGD